MTDTSPSAGVLAGAIPKGRVAFVGVGPGDPGLLTLRASELLGAADAVVYGPEPLPDFIAEFVPCGVPMLQAPADVPFDRAELALAVPTAIGDTGRHVLVVRLCGEDPGSWPRLGIEVEAVRMEGYDVEVVPGISAMATVPSYLGVTLADRSSREVLVAWDDQIAPADFSGASPEDVTVVLRGTHEQVTDGLSKVLASGRSADAPVAFNENATTVRQRTVVTTLGDSGQALASSGFGDRVVAVVSRNVVGRDRVEWFESRPLFGWRVLVPRTKDQAGATVAGLAQYGAIGEVVPTISVEPPRTPQQIRRAVTGLVEGRYQWVVFTSVNAVRAVRERLEEVGLDSRALAGVKVASVGEVTTTALRDWGVEPDLMPESDHSSKGLVATWPAYDAELDPINRVFLPRADIATETLVGGLRELGWDPEDVTAYRTVRAAPPPAPVREAIKKGHFDAVLFTSGSTVRNLVGIAGKPHPSTVVACIGTATARTAEDLGLHVSVIAPIANSEALVEALAAHGRERQAQARAEGRPITRPSQRKEPSRRA
ncbi:MAG: uroporphyrinogen-III synthase [Dermatophilus congolensis]|nr:uroporphyrinogen-III synthase [Dermatophilus congolensis]